MAASQNVYEMRETFGDAGVTFRDVGMKTLIPKMRYGPNSQWSGKTPNISGYSWTTSDISGNLNKGCAT